MSPSAITTGRHTATMVGLGHETMGVDRSPAMLAVARDKVPGARFEVGELTPLPAEDKSFDPAVCALALCNRWAGGALLRRGPDGPRLRRGPVRRAAEAAAATWDDLPAALVWTLERV